MSEQSQDPQVPTNDSANAPVKAKVARKPRVIEHSAAIKAYALHLKIDEHRAGKLFRTKLRANGDVLRKHKSPSANHKKNDTWSAHSRAALREILPNVKAFKG